MKADTDNALDTLTIEIDGQQATFDVAMDKLADEHEKVLDKLRREFKAEVDKLTEAHEAAKEKLLTQRDDLIKCKDTLQAALDKAEELEPVHE